jgi:hypothetical protein
MVYFSLVKFYTVCKTSSNTDVYTTLQFQRATKSIEEVERIESRVNNSKKKEWLTTKEEKEQVPPTTLDRYFISNKIAET